MYLHLGWIQTLGGPVPRWWPTADVDTRPDITSFPEKHRELHEKQSLQTQGRVRCLVAVLWLWDRLHRGWRVAGLGAPVWVSWSRTPKALSTTLATRPW